MYYVVTIEAGYERDTEPFEITRYIEASSTVKLFEELEKHPGFMSAELGYVITMVQPVSKEEFLEGKGEEKDDLNLLRKNVRFHVKKKCFLEAIGRNVPFKRRLDAETTACSVGGAGIKYKGKALELGSKVKVTIEELEINNKEAKVVWVSSREGESKVGLKWL